MFGCRCAWLVVEKTVVKEGMEKWLDKFGCIGKNEVIGRIGGEKVEKIKVEVVNG